MKTLITILSLFFVVNSFAQEENIKNHSHSRALIPLKYYKQQFKKPLTQKDSLNFVYRDNDTLVVIENYKPKGIRVPYEYKDSTFLDAYTKVAFTYSNDSLKNKTVMKYWKDDVSIFFSKSIPKKTKKDFMVFANSLVNKIDSLNINVVKHVEDSNYIIYNSGDFEYESRMVNNKESEYYMYWNGNNQIYKTTIKIITSVNFNEKAKLIAMKKLFFQSLGNFTFNNELECINYFSGCFNENSTVSNFDIELLKYHYSYGICKGTNYETFMEQHKKAKDVLKNKNVRIGFFHQD